MEIYKMDDEEMTTPKNPGDALAAFDKWLESRSLSTEKLDPKEWGHATYKHSHIQAMWEGWEAALTPSPDYVMVPRGTVEKLCKFIIQHGPHKDDKFYGDHACAECYPHSELIAAGFQCAYHTAIKMQLSAAPEREG